jgi:uncharacterized protein YraI
MAAAAKGREEFMIRVPKPTFAALALLLAMTAGASGQTDPRREHVDFAGWTGAAIDGEIVGRDFDRYELNAVAGDTLTVRLHTPHTGTYFNVYAPGNGPGDQALANSSMTGGAVLDLNQFSGALPTTGVYEVVVYMVRSAARRDEVAPYAIEFDLLQPTADNDPDAAELFFQVRTRSAGGHLNVHTGPSVDSPRLGRYNNGSVLRDIGGCAANEGREWCEVMAFEGGLAGFVAGEFLAPVSRHRAAPITPPRHANTRPVAPPRPTVASTVTSTSDYFHVHLTNPQGHLGVHSEPSTRSVRVGRLPDGADVRNIGGCVASEGRTWCDVMQAGGGISGWVARSFCATATPPDPQSRRKLVRPVLSRATSPTEWRADRISGRSTLATLAARCVSTPVLQPMHPFSRASMRGPRCAMPEVAG